MLDGHAEHHEACAGGVALLVHPGLQHAPERHGAVGRDLATAGPVAVTESWDRLRSDSAHHAVLWITEWPRSQVYPGFLAPLVLSNGILRTLALHYTPVRADQAARDLRKKKTELISDAAQRRKIGQIDDAASSAELDDVLQQEADLTAGHGVLRVSGLVSVSAPTVDELDAAVAAVAGTAEARKVSLSVDLEAAPAAVITDKSWFGVAVQRVLAEAIDCTPASGAVRVAWEESGTGSGWLSVTDGGPPVVLAQPRELAMPFDVRRVQPAARDARTGLGLAIAAALSQMMGSDLEIAGTGEGAVYRIRLASE